MESFKLQDKDSESLRQMFEFQKQKMISILEGKLRTIQAITADDCCDISYQQLVLTRNEGKQDWDTFIVLAGRIVARKNALEANIAREIVREKHKDRPDLKGQRQGGA